ncbi:ribosomal protein S5-alanine N-acetyltransferase [Vibrio sp. ZSDZ34]|jgi:ribosomal-protein-alanine N-acetyltransferase|uniref:Ribosomal protein S5-alanine N-acetyltransferase n=1 Tax=Vibrio gelatinilyticus TaxID=2893468 RepID=A0A9X1W7U4_9VIBR|nr:ribosomal protein S5-alanine N-acetyltransferase [Vibrio gelatinilyticus]MCJ2375229.1 ribosomal protein S5-alanine N-acetyltransferase [Vibrio gelatinilyticus]
MKDFSSSLRLHKEHEGIVVRCSLPGDAHTIANYFQANKRFLAPWEPARDSDFYRPENWAAKLIKLDELHRLSLAYYCLILDSETQEMLGTVSFSNLVRFPFHSCNLGYSLAENAQGKGVMRKALAMAIPYMFDIQNMHRISASYMPRNKRSEAVLQHHQFEKEGFAKDYLLINGQWEDHVLTSLVNPHWLPKE